MPGIPGGWELILILLVVMLLFGAKRLPDSARSLGRSLRIFKAETKGLREDDERLRPPAVEPSPRVVPSPSPVDRPVAERGPVVEPGTDRVSGTERVVDPDRDLR